MEFWREYCNKDNSVEYDGANYLIGFQSKIDTKEVQIIEEGGSKLFLVKSIKDIVPCRILIKKI